MYICKICFFFHCPLRISGSLLVHITVCVLQPEIVETAFKCQTLHTSSFTVKCGSLVRYRGAGLISKTNL